MRLQGEARHDTELFDKRYRMIISQRLTLDGMLCESASAPERSDAYTVAPLESRRSKPSQVKRERERILIPVLPPPCYLTEKHTCFVRSTVRPLPLCLFEEGASNKRQSYAL